MGRGTWGSLFPRPGFHTLPLWGACIPFWSQKQRQQITTELTILSRKTPILTYAREWHFFCIPTALISVVESLQVIEHQHKWGTYRQQSKDGNIHNQHHLFKDSSPLTFQFQEFLILLSSEVMYFRKSVISWNISITFSHWLFSVLSVINSVTLLFSKENQPFTSSSTL